MPKKKPKTLKNVDESQIEYQVMRDFMENTSVGELALNYELPVSTINKYIKRCRQNTALLDSLRSERQNNLFLVNERALSGITRCIYIAEEMLGRHQKDPINSRLTANGLSNIMSALTKASQVCHEQESELNAITGSTDKGALHQASQQAREIINQQYENVIIDLNKNES